MTIAAPADTSSMIFIDQLLQPDSGGVCALYCPECKKTEFFHSEYLVRPKVGDYWYMQGCRENVFHGLPSAKLPWRDEWPRDLL